MNSAPGRISCQRSSTAFTLVKKRWPPTSKRQPSLSTVREMPPTVSSASSTVHVFAWRASSDDDDVVGVCARLGIRAPGWVLGCLRVTGAGTVGVHGHKYAPGGGGTMDRRGRQPLRRLILPLLVLPRPGKARALTKLSGWRPLGLRFSGGPLSWASELGWRDRASGW